MPKSSILSLINLKGGLNNTDQPTALPDDQVVEATNVEFLFSQLGERRLGCASIDIAGSGLDLESSIVFLGSFQPAQADLINSEIWAAAATIGTNVKLSRRVGNTWNTVTSADTLNPNSASVGRMQAQSIHGKYFFAAQSNVNRIHVWDGVTFRRAGLAGPIAAPTAIDTVAGGSFADVRYYRVRFSIQNAGTTILKSEPSDELTFTPSGANSGAIVTRPAIQDGNETHWILEASSGDGNWYDIATTIIGTTTATDTTIPATSYATFELSPDIGDHTVIPSVKFVVADQDRLVFGGSWEDSSQGSRVSWTPVYGATGVGNDERIPLDTNNYVDLDWMGGGGNLTGLSKPVNGSLYAFKLTSIYKLQRSGDIDAAYVAYQLSAARGAIEGSIINGSDEFGGSCVYFLDPSIGPCRIGSAGMQSMDGLQQTWKTVNVNALPIISHGIYYPDKQQVHWWVATNSSVTPTLKIIVQVSEIRSNEHGATDRGFSLADGLIATAWCSHTIPEVVTQGVVERLSFRPYIGLINPGGIKRCDVGSTDDGTTYTASITTKPYLMSGLLGQWGGMAASLLGDAIDDEAMQMSVSLIRDFGKESNSVTVDFVPESTESVVNAKMDNLDMSQAYAIQVKFQDV